MRYVLFLLGSVLLVVYSPATFSQDKEKKDPPAVKEEKEPDTTAEDLQTLKTVGLAAEGPALLEYLRKRTFKEADPKKLDILIRALGEEYFPAREKAYQELLQLGPTALVALKAAAEKNADTEARRRAHDLQARIEAKQEPAIQKATARMLARLKPAGAADVLLAYLPFAEPSVIDELAKALAAVTVVGGKVEPAVPAALGDKLALKRGVAAEALIRAKVAEHKDAARKLLKDAEPAVRLRTALALVPQRDAELVPVLVELLKHLPPEQMWPAEEILVNLAGDQAPAVSLGGNEAARKTCHDAWDAWLKKAGKLDMAKLEQPALRGLTVFVYQDQNFVGRRLISKVVELDRDKKVKWQFDVPTNAVDAQVVGPDRVLIAEYNGGRVTERDTKGNVHWDLTPGGNPIGVQRLPGGNTLITMQQQVLEYNKDKQQVWSFQRPNSDIFRAKKLRSGDVVLLTNNGTVIHVDAKAKRETKSFFGGQPNILFGSIDVLPNGHILVPVMQNNKVSEYSADGREVRKWDVPQPTAVVRLPNGHLLVTSYYTQMIVQLDRSGAQVWTHQVTNGRPFNARGR